MDTLTPIGRGLMIAGAVLLTLGGALWLAGRLNLPLGRLPGDIHFQRGGVSCFFPLATSILISLLLTLAINLIARWINR